MSFYSKLFRGEEHFYKPFYLWMNFALSPQNIHKLRQVWVIQINFKIQVWLMNLVYIFKINKWILLPEIGIILVYKHKFVSN